MPSSIPQGIALLTRAGWAFVELTLLFIAALGWVWAAHAIARRAGKAYNTEGARSRVLPSPSFGLLARVPEYFLYVGIIVFMTAVYGYAGFLSTSQWFGFSHVGHIGLPLAFAFLCLFTFLAMRLSPTAETSELMTGLSRRLATRWWPILLVVLFVGLAIPFLTTNINPDGIMWRDYFQNTAGPVLSLDEILELYVHYVFIHTIGRAMGWGVIESYQVLSVVAGAFFVYVLARFSAVLVPESSGWLFCWAMTGGVMQLFVGEVENYSLVTPIMLVYLWVGVLYLSGRVSLLLPSVVLAVAAAFHLLVVFLGPSWLYLCWLETRRRGARDVLLSVTAGAAILTATFFFVHFVVFGFRRFSTTIEVLTAISHGLDANIWARLVHRGLVYHIELANLVFLLVPQVLVIVPLLLYRRVTWDPVNVFLGCSAASSVLMILAWPAGLGVKYDWNVFAPMSVALSIWCGYNVLRQKALPYKAAIVIGLIALGAIHTYSWIGCNRFQSCS
jgi:hypothetical protein